MSLAEAQTNDVVLGVENLSVSFSTRQGEVRAVDGLSLHVGRKEVLGIVGESGSGKSVAMYSMLGLVRDANVSITGSVRFEGREILYNRAATRHGELAAASAPILGEIAAAAGQARTG